MEEVSVLKNESLKSEKISLQGMRILIAEDNDSNYLLLTYILKGSILERAKNGEEAVQIAKDAAFDLILMDIKMPVLDGYYATRYIRCFDDKTPIIALTANAFDSDKERALSEGCNDYITKPIRRQHLIDTILNCLELCLSRDRLM